MKPEDIYSLMDVCLGKERPSVLIKNATLVDVYTRELLCETDIAMKGKYIAFVGKWKYGENDPELVIDAQGLYAIPGFIDGHTHFAYLVEPSESIRYAIPTGTTSIVTELMELYPLLGLEGLLYFMDLLKGQPIKFFFTVPSAVFTQKSPKGMPEEDLSRLLSLQEVLGMGESYWQGVLQERELFVPSMLKSRILNKTLEGHSAGARGERLLAYLCCGISSCHEPTNPQEALERARLGLTVMIREGAVRRELHSISEILRTEIDKRRFVLSSDGVDPEELLERGYMDLLVNKAISLGVDPISAIQMASLNVAEHFHMEGWVGGISPSKFADILLSERLDVIRPKFVFSSGNLIAMEGKVLMEPNPIDKDERLICVPRVQRRFSGNDFILRTEIRPNVRAYTIRMVTDLVTQMEVRDLAVEEGRIRWEEAQDLNLVAAIERRSDPNQFFLGLVSHFGLQKGAFACSAGWDTTDMIVIGRDENDMATAANRVFDLKGGAVVVVDGRLIWELPMPILGIMSNSDLRRLVEAFKEMREILSTLGVKFRDPLLSLVTLSTSAIPFFRICHEGYVDLKSGKTLGLGAP